MKKLRTGVADPQEQTKMSLVLPNVALYRQRIHPCLGRRNRLRLGYGASADPGGSGCITQPQANRVRRLELQGFRAAAALLLGRRPDSRGRSVLKVSCLRYLTKASGAIKSDGNNSRQIVVERLTSRVREKPRAFSSPFTIAR